MQLEDMKNKYEDCLKEKVAMEIEMKKLKKDVEMS